MRDVLKPPLRVMGIDPGIERTGFAVLEIRGGGKTPALLDCGRILTDRTRPVPERLQTIAEDMQAVLRQWNPAAAAIEQVYFTKHVKSLMAVSHARGVILEVLEEHGVAVQELNPSVVKASVTGDGRADKLQMRKMIRVLLGADVPQDDTVDAIACGLCALGTMSL